MASKKIMLCCRNFKSKASNWVALRLLKLSTGELLYTRIKSSVPRRGLIFMSWNSRHAAVCVLKVKQSEKAACASQKLSAVFKIRGGPPPFPYHGNYSNVVRELPNSILPCFRTQVAL